MDPKLLKRFVDQNCRQELFLAEPRYRPKPGRCEDCGEICHRSIVIEITDLGQIRSCGRCRRKLSNNPGVSAENTK